MKKILLIEDDPGMVYLLNDLLSSAGYDVGYVYDGCFALQFLGLEPEPELKARIGPDWLLFKNKWLREGNKTGLPDLLILDVTMPRMDGYTFLSHLSCGERTCGLPVLVLTNKTRMEDSFKQFPNVVKFVAKPFEADDLLRIVRELIKP